MTNSAAMPAADNYAIVTRGLSRQFGGTRAVNNLNLAIEKAQIFGFLGPNGCGKSTSIRLLTGLLKPTSGSACVLGFNLPAAAEQLRQHIGYMTQKFSLYPNLTPEENLAFVARIYGLNRNAAKTRIEFLLQQYQLAARKTQMAGTLSGGQKQRLALACAVLHQPRLLFLDEPTSAVDPENRREFWERLFDLCEQGTSILVSTHYMDEAERCHGLAIMDQGELMAQGSPQILMEQMAAHVVEVDGENVRALKNTLLQFAQCNRTNQKL
ncbi:MAG TPA: ABC transporter ATP-binding protein, partial [Cellvibrionaceae bacterium]|nr:ABC transporter ATP-binding protein [Cellvibrionaceae bacterium]